MGSNINVKISGNKVITRGTTITKDSRFVAICTTNQKTVYRTTEIIKVRVVSQGLLHLTQNLTFTKVKE